MTVHVCHLSSVHRALDGRIFYREARSLVAHGYAVTVVARHPRDEVVDGVRILGLNEPPRVRRPLLWRSLLEKAGACRADVYHIHDPELLLLVPWLRRMTGRPVIYDVHEANADFVAMKAGRFAALQEPVRQGMGWLEPRLTRACAGVITADAQIAQSFTGLPLPQTVLYNYPTADFLRQAIGTPFTRTEPVVLHLGTHTEARGARLMIEAFAHVHAGCPRARLLLVGPFYPSALADHVRAWAAAAGVGDAITLVGRAPFGEVGRYLRQATVGWVPLQATPKYERNIPTKLFEYMAYSLPVVSSALASVRPYLAAGEAGLLVDPPDPAAHGAALLALLRNPVRAADMGAAGRRLVETRYNWTALEGRLWDLYSEVVALDMVDRRPRSGG